MKLNIAVTAIALAALASITTEARAQTTLYGCYVKNTGTMYRIKVPGTPSSCSSNHTEFSWNMEGQVGPQGPEGPQGPQGPAGTSGWPGVEIRTVQYVVPAGTGSDITAFCLPNEVMLTGGFAVEGLITDYLLLSSSPKWSDATSRFGWNVRLKNTMQFQQFSLKVVAYCRLAIS